LAEYIRLLPEITLIIFGTAIMLLEGLAGEKSARNTDGVAILGLLVALGFAIVAGMNPGEAFQSMIIVDGFATFFRVLVIAVGIFVVLSSTAYLKKEKADCGEYYALILFSLSGQCILASANELIMVFIGLEISSIATYILAGFLRDDKRNNEAAVKYFLLGSFATAFLLYGVAWIYGITGSTNLEVIRQSLSTPGVFSNAALATFAVALMFVGFGFKVSAAPFQVWAPDVYQGAPAPVTMFMSAAPKAAAFAVFIRVFMTAFSGLANQWTPVIWLSALATMIIGNFAALTQTNIKRVLAYSSIAHAGYVMVAIAANSQIGTAAAMFYLAAYATMNVGAFAAITHLVRKGETHTEITDLAGLGKKQPITAALFALFLFSLVGIPLTGGFFGKFYIFKAAIDSNLIWLTVLGLLNSAVAAYYYLRIIVMMYFHEPAESMQDLAPAATGIQITMWCAALGTLALGIYPSFVLDLAGIASVLTP
jgi:NADH-quinone oxidoreductase subunit N